MPQINLDEARASRAVREDLVVVFNGEEYIAPGDAPAKFAIAFTKGDLEGGLAALFGNEPAARMVDAGLTVGDLEALAGELSSYYGVGDAGNSQASGRSLSRTSTPSRPTSPGSTGSTSPEPSAQAS